MNLTSPDTIFKHGASPSMVTLWLLCRHKWWLHYVARAGRREKEAQRDAGSTFHNFLEAHYSPLGEAMSFEDHVELFKQDFPDEQSTEKRDQKHMLAILKGYLDRYPLASEPFEVIDTEQKLNVEVEGCKLRLNCIIDLATDWRGGLWVCDHKTSGRLGSTYFDQFRNHWQTYTYIYAAAIHYNCKCEGILYNALGMKKKIDGDSFLRKDFPKTQNQIDFNMERWTRIVNEMHGFVYENWEYRERFHATTTPTACRAYMVNCAFLDYCEFNQNPRLLP